MNLPARGWQYITEDIGNGRVRKTYNSWFEAYGVMLRDSFRHRRLPVIRFSRYYNEGKVAAARSLARIKGLELDKSLLGNPTLLNEYDYEQDKIKPLSDFFKSVSVEEGKKVVDKFVLFNFDMMSKTLMEKNFNIADNYGLNISGNIILTDLGELCFKKEEIISQLKKRVWAAPDVVAHLPSEIKAYFVQQMDVHFTNHTVML